MQSAGQRVVQGNLLIQIDGKLSVTNYSAIRRKIIVHEQLFSLRL